MYLTIFVCMLAGSPCKPVPLPFDAAQYRFDDATKCSEIGAAIESLWLKEHRDWQEGGVRCAPEPPK